MREIRLSGSEGGGFDFGRFSLPLSPQIRALLVRLFPLIETSSNIVWREWGNRRGTYWRFNL
jgi:hypothetical protein